jgi:hypothetical protein
MANAVILSIASKLHNLSRIQCKASVSIDTDAFFLAAFCWQLNYDAFAHFKFDHEIVQVLTVFA